MDINEFVDELAKETNSKYIITYVKDYKWYVLTLYNPYISESVIVTERVLRNKKTSFKRIDLIKKLMESKEKFFEDRMKAYMED